RQRVSAPSCPVQHFISVPMCCPAVPAQCPMMCPPAQVMMPAPPAMCPPGMSGCCMAGCPMPPGLTPVQVPVPEPVPMRMVSVPEAMLQMAVNHVVHQSKPVIRIDVRDGQVHIVSKVVEICCDSATPTPDGRALLHGNVCATFRGEHLPAKI